MTMTESSSESALREELSKAQDEARQVKADLEESARRVAVLESECAKRGTADEQIRALEDQIEDLTGKLKKAEEALTAPSSPELGSPKTQSDDEYIVVEPGSPNTLENKLKEREAEIRKAIAHAKKLEEMYNTAEERTLTFEKQVHVLEANMFEKFDDANALLEKVKELEELLTAGQIQIAALEEKSKMCDEAQKKVEYEKVLFLETEDQLVKNFKKAHDEAEQYRNMIFQLETSVKIAEEKAAHAEKCMEFASQRNQELESEIADLNFQIQRISRERSSYESSKLKSDTKLLELHKALAMFQDKADFLEQELEMYRGREKKVDDDVRSVDEKNVVHEATSSHVVDTSQEVLVGESMDGHASTSDLELDLAHGKSNSIDDEMKFLGENVVAHVTHSKLLMSEFAKLQSAHILYACEAESSKTQLKDNVKDLEGKVRQLEQEIIISREGEERMKEEAKVMEAKAMEESSLFEGLRMSYADYTCDLERKNAKLEEELITLREEVAANIIEQQKWTLDCDRMRNAESRSESLEALVVDLRTNLGTPRVCDMCSQLKTQIQDVESRSESLEALVVDLQTKLEAPRVCDMCSQLKTQIQDAESRSESLEALVVDLQTKFEAPRECDTCSQLKTQIQDVEVMLGELSLELEVSRRREYDVQKEVKSMEEKSASHEQLAFEWKEKAMAQVMDHNVRVQALEAQMRELQEENLQAQTSIKENRSWAEKAASVLREHAENLHELRGGCPDIEHRLTTGKSLGKEEKEALQAKVEGLHLEFRDMQLCDGSEALQLCKELLSLERDCLNYQMLDIAYRNTNLESELGDLKSQIQNLQNPPESPAKEVKKSFREVTLDGEVQSLRAQLIELQSLRARVSEIPSLQAHLAQLQLSLRAAETRELEQNLELVKVQRKVSAAEKEVCSLKSALLNQTETNELKKQVNLLEQNLIKSEANIAFLKEEIDVYVKSKIGLEVEVTDKVTDEFVLEQAPESEQQADIRSPQRTKPKARKRKHRKSGKAPIVQETIQTADRSSIFRFRIVLFLFSVLLGAIFVRFSSR